jgi:hypothetical protein
VQLCATPSQRGWLWRARAQATQAQAQARARFSDSDLRLGLGLKAAARSKPTGRASLPLLVDRTRVRYVVIRTATHASRYAGWKEWEEGGSRKGEGKAALG